MVHLTFVVSFIIHYLLVHVAVAQDTAMLKAMLIQDHRIFCQLEEEEEKQGYSGALSLLITPLLKTNIINIL